MSIRVVLFALLLGLTSWTALPAHAAERVLSGRAIYQNVIKGAVTVWVNGGNASGFLVDREKRLVVTNAHVVGWRTEVQVQFPEFRDGKLFAERSYYKTAAKIAAKVLHVDRVRDLAVIELASLPDYATALPLSKEDVQAGDQLHMVGNPSPSDAMWLYTFGTARQVYKTRFKYSDAPEFSGWVIESQLPTNYGDSGAPVVNGRGEVVGVHMGGAPNGGFDLRMHVHLTEIRAVLAAASSQPTVPQPTTAADFARKGLEHHWSLQDDLALAAFDESLKLDSKQASVFVDRAFVFYLKGEFVKAINDCDEGLSLNPKLASGYKYRGIAFAELKEPHQAIADYTRAIELDPNDAWTFLYRSWAYANIGDQANAAADRSQAIKLDPKTATAW